MTVRSKRQQGQGHHHSSELAPTGSLRPILTRTDLAESLVLDNADGVIVPFDPTAAAQQYQQSHTEEWQEKS